MQVNPVTAQLKYWQKVKKGANIWPVKNPVGQPLTTNVVIEGEKYRSRVCGEGISERDVFF